MLDLSSFNATDRRGFGQGFAAQLQRLIVNPQERRGELRKLADDNRASLVAGFGFICSKKKCEESCVEGHRRGATSEGDCDWPMHSAKTAGVQHRHTVLLLHAHHLSSLPMLAHGLPNVVAGQRSR